MEQRQDRLDQLIATARAGDSAAYRAFLVESALRLRAFLARRSNGGLDVEDLVQECLLAIHEKRATLDPDRPVAPWIYAIARYKLADHWRRVSRTPPITDELPEIKVPADEGCARDVAVLLDKLPAEQAEAIRLTRLRGMTGPEASRREGVTLSALKLRIHRGMIALRKIVADE